MTQKPITSEPQYAAPLSMAEWLRERGESAAAGMITHLVDELRKARAPKPDAWGDRRTWTRRQHVAHTWNESFNTTMFKLPFSDISERCRRSNDERRRVA